MHRRVELLRYLDGGQAHSSVPTTPDRFDANETHKMSKDTSDYVNLAEFVAVPQGGVPDPAKKVHNSSQLYHINFMTLTITKDFVKKLKSYALRWTSNMAMLPEVTSYDHFSDEQRGHIDIVSNLLYRHKTLQLKYTTYDMREDKDVMNKRKHPGIMVASDDEKHPYLYGSVIDLFHIKVRNRGPYSLFPDGGDPTLPIVWVRWFKHNVTGGPSGFHSLRYPSISFCKSDEPDAFGLIHPDEIIRAVHLIPRFNSGCTDEYLNVPSWAHPGAEQTDWRQFNVNM